MKEKDNIINPTVSLGIENDYFGFIDKEGDLVPQGQVPYLKLHCHS